MIAFVCEFGQLLFVRLISVGNDSFLETSVSELARAVPRRYGIDLDVSNEAIPITMMI